MEVPREKYKKADKDYANNTITYDEYYEVMNEYKRIDEEHMRILWLKLAVTAHCIQKCKEIRRVLED